jgi:hypothetical protein
MSAFLKISTSLLLLIDGLGAIYGGSNLIVHPDGSSIQLSLDLLKHTPFQNYLIPGIILLVANGLFSVFAFTALVLRIPNYARLIMIQGALLTGWILTQMVLIQTVYFLHFILGSIGMALIITGFLLNKINSNQAAHHNMV